MKTAGSILRETREARGYTLATVEQATKIRVKFLDAIERDEYHLLPSLAYAKGFIKNYADYLGLSSSDVLAFFRRQMQETPRSSLLPKGMEVPLEASEFRLTPSRFVAGLVILLVGAFLLYFIVQYRTLQQPPKLAIDAPANQLITRDKRIDVTGQTDPDATVTINGVSVLVRSDGKFFDQVQLESGVNKLTIVATSRYGKSTTVLREVGLEAAGP